MRRGVVGSRRMAEQLDPHDLITLDELALSNMWEIAALVQV